MVIQIRGTSGSGKSWVMRQVMERTKYWVPEYVEGRKQPLLYKWAIRKDPRNMCILGHYETACGGCDTIGSARKVYQLIKELGGTYNTILCEGLLLSEDVKWSSQLSDLYVIYLVTPLEDCLSNVESRRRAVRNDKPLNPRNTSNRVLVIERSRVKLKEAGVTCIRLSANQAVNAVIRMLKCKTNKPG